MVINGSSPWIDFRNGTQRLSIQRQMKMASGSKGMCLNADPNELRARDLEVYHFRELIRAIPDIREERVTQVRGDIEDGTYNIVAERIAEKIIGDDLPDIFF